MNENEALHEQVTQYAKTLDRNLSKHEMSRLIFEFAMNLKKKSLKKKDKDCGLGDVLDVIMENVEETKE